MCHLPYPSGPVGSVPEDESMLLGSGLCLGTDSTLFTSRLKRNPRLDILNNYRVPGVSPDPRELDVVVVNGVRRAEGEGGREERGAQAKQTTTFFFLPGTSFLFEQPPRDPAPPTSVGK